MPQAHPAQAPPQHSNSSPPPVRRVALYCRVSTDRQAAKEDSSLDTQRDRLLAYIEDKRRAGLAWELSETFIEGESPDGKRRGKSAKTLNRPILKRLLEKVRAHAIDIVLITKIDRISRGVVDFLGLVEELEAHGVKLISLKEEINTDSAMGRVITTFMIALAQFEREQIAERTREKVRWRAGKGLPISRCPIGYKMVDKRAVVAPQEAQLVRTLFQTYLHRRRLSEVVRVAFDKGLRTRRGTAVGAGTLGRILKNPFYLGKVLHRGELHPGQHEAIIDQKTFDRVTALLLHNRAHHASGHGFTRARGYPYFLSGLLRCSKCGSHLTPKTSLGRKHQEYFYYLCSLGNRTSGLACSTDCLDARAADEFVLDYLSRLALEKGVVERISKDRKASVAREVEGLHHDQDRVKNELAEVHRKTTNLVEAIGRMQGSPSNAMLARVRNLEDEEHRLAESLARIEAQIAHLEEGSVQAAQTQATLKCLADILASTAPSPAQLKDLLPRFVDTIIWKPAEDRKSGTFEIAIFEQPFRLEGGPSLREVVQEFPPRPAETGGSAPSSAAGPGSTPSSTPGHKPLGSLTTPAFNHHSPRSIKGPLVLSEESETRPPHLVVPVRYHLVYRDRRRVLVADLDLTPPKGIRPFPPPIPSAARLIRKPRTLVPPQVA